MTNPAGEYPDCPVCGTSNFPGHFCVPPGGGRMLGGVPVIVAERCPFCQGEILPGSMHLRLAPGPARLGWANAGCLVVTGLAVL